ncbi:ABC transporter ATP-binding protein [Actinospica sp. MGRD01-02]|uniref:ABC transporter ATP-binding protein n=1 Tax=Actinospica acidithermotolerans TaxID=2828514 RepID=A0A941INJ3_9ACTN|nr:ABC transporter ATP-binding protein [Actinospica acidithermotolerans]MBR7829556.1 ABC transporter ATP-binding protein [Actinospica acidithermotolerans]
MIQATELTKRYGTRLAVDHADFTVAPGKVTGFLGPNGAGKSTTMRMILGLDRPTSGSVTINGVPYHRLAAPLREVGALLDAKAVHGGRSAYNHLLVLAKANGLPRSRVDAVIDLVGLHSVAGKRSGGFSLGMGQRLGIAAALLGDPGIVMFDEPVNGLDPEGILWIRNLMKALAAEGRTVFVSSHLMSEMALTADHLVVIGLGRILADEPMAEFIAKNSVSYVRVRSPQPAELAPKLALRGWRVERQPDESLHVYDTQPAQIGDVAGAEGLWLHELTLVQSSLEEAFMRLTAGSVEYHAGQSDDQGSPDGPAVAGWGTPLESQAPQAPQVEERIQ